MQGIGGQLLGKTGSVGMFVMFLGHMGDGVGQRGLLQYGIAPVGMLAVNEGFFGCQFSSAGGEILRDHQDSDIMKQCGQRQLIQVRGVFYAHGEGSGG